MITKRELIAKPEQVDITVVTKDSSEYKFLKDNYRIQNDTLIGFGLQTIRGNDAHFHGSISIMDITSLKTEKFDVVGTSLAIGLPVVLVGALLLVLSAGLANP